MTVRIGPHEFDDVVYDGKADVLYLSKGQPRAATASRETTEGHVIRMDEAGRVIGITLVNPAWLLAEGKRIVVTLPDAVEPDPAEIAGAMGGEPRRPTLGG